MTGLIVAYDKNRLIGNNGKMPWYIPGELKRFRTLTENNVVIMGRKTYEAIGKPLANRVNIILTRDIVFNADGCVVVHSLADGIKLRQEKWPDKKIYIGGGGQIYKQALDIVDEMYITEIDGEYCGDTYFPEFDESLFTKEIVETVDGETPYTYVTYRRKRDI